MPGVRKGRRTYYNIFSHMYDAFVKIHARRDGEYTRAFLVETARTESIDNPDILDICCGTGSVIIAFAACYTGNLSVGYDFSRGMLEAVRKKPGAEPVVLVEGDAAKLPFSDECFDFVTCSHALYELKARARQEALLEMRRVVRADGAVFIMEHEVPRRPFVKFMFNLRMLSMGAADGKEFVEGGLEPFKKVFPDVSLSHSPSGKSKLVICRK